MPSIPPEKIAAWVVHHFPDHKVRKKGREYQINSPFDGDTGYNMNISVSRAACHDWRGDQWAGYTRDGKPCKRTFLHFVRLYLGCSWGEAVRSVLGQDARRAMLWSQPEPVLDEVDVALPEGSQKLLSSPEKKQSRMLLHWLRTRGVFEEDIRRYDIHHYGSEVVWPYYEYERIVYWQSRSRMSKRFRFPPQEVGVTKGQFLFGFDQVEPASHLVIVEAIFGVHSVRNQAVATGGAALQSEQLAKIRALGPRDGVILAPDNDKAGIQSTITNGRLLLERGYKVYYSLPPRLPYEADGKRSYTKDWNELGENGLVPWVDIPSVMERAVKKFDMAALVELNRRCG